ncbi:hypothetical protein CYMTET_39701 [Cymbomonas tetramitiformis]|uniref:Uncharacterized protein n=1 Tax=Cymbomonas tetramitiformis TaxID=36881 RepID=A0AAE0CBT9_9CHLO|nr:hypothetical protein CYMTET_39701 [Cymbomonas tetramitiformis]
MGQLKGDPAKWETDRQKEQITEGADQTTDDEPDGVPEYNTAQDRVNQQQIADQQLEEEEIQLREMMAHAIQDAENTTEPQTQAEQQQEQQNEQEEMLLHEVLDRMQRDSTEVTPPRNRQEQHTKNAGQETPKLEITSKQKTRKEQGIIIRGPPQTTGATGAEPDGAT